MLSKLPILLPTHSGGSIAPKRTAARRTLQRQWITRARKPKGPLMTARRHTSQKGGSKCQNLASAWLPITMQSGANAIVNRRRARNETLGANVTAIAAIATGQPVAFRFQLWGCIVYTERTEDGIPLQYCEEISKISQCSTANTSFPRELRYERTSATWVEA